jgi:hypothetical protein
MSGPFAVTGTPALVMQLDGLAARSPQPYRLGSCNNMGRKAASITRN